MPRVACLVLGIAVSSLLSGCATSTPMSYKQWKAKLERIARAEGIRQENAQARRENPVIFTAAEQQRAAQTMPP